MEVINVISLVGIVITTLWLLVLVFKNEGVLMGIVCFFIYPIVYIYALFKFRVYGTPFIIYILSFVAWYATGPEI